MKTNTLLALLAGGLLVYILMSKKSSKDEPKIPTCKEDEELRTSQPNCLVPPCPPIYSCEKKLKI